MSSGKLSKAWGQQQPLTRGGHGQCVTHNNNHNDDDDDYASEQRWLMPHLTPLVWGGTCMAVTLFSLRFGRWYQQLRSTVVVVVVELPPPPPTTIAWVGLGT